MLYKIILELQNINLYLNNIINIERVNKQCLIFYLFYYYLFHVFGVTMFSYSPGLYIFCLYVSHTVYKIQIIIMFMHIEYASTHLAVIVLSYEFVLSFKNLYGCPVFVISVYYCIL